MRKRFRSIVVSSLFMHPLVILVVVAMSGVGTINVQSESVSAIIMRPDREELIRNFVVQRNESTAKTNVTDLRGLMRSLRRAGLVVKQDGRISQPFFSIKGRILKVNGEDLQVFEYTNRTVAEKQAEKITPTGSAVGTSMPMWLGPPHFYKKDRLIVLYIGRSSSVTKILERVLGAQFAGQ